MGLALNCFFISFSSSIYFCFFIIFVFFSIIVSFFFLLRLNSSQTVKCLTSLNLFFFVLWRLLIFYTDFTLSSYLSLYLYSYYSSLLCCEFHSIVSSGIVFIGPFIEKYSKSSSRSRKLSAYCRIILICSSKRTGLGSIPLVTTLTIAYLRWFLRKFDYKNSLHINFVLTNVSQYLGHL